MILQKVNLGGDSALGKLIAMCNGKYWLLRYQNKTSQSGNLLKKDRILKVLRFKTEHCMSAWLSFIMEVPKI